MSRLPLEQRKIKYVQANSKSTACENKPERSILRTAAYCRVSTDTKEQETSFDSQVLYYSKKIAERSDWLLVKIYADPAVSGTSRRNRLQFDEMLYDCIHGKIDQIITKSMSRFARNQLDCLAVIRLLKGLHPPVSVLFEDDKIDSADLSTEVVMTIFSMLAEQESAKKSDNVRWGFDRRREQGHYLTPVNNLLAYDKTQAFNKDDREMVIIEDEAQIVRCIYKMFLIGYRPSEIALEMSMAGVATSKGNTLWSSNSVLGILKNERYAGDVRTNKTYRENYRVHHTIKNHGEREYVYETDHHPAIVSHAEFEVAQRLIASHKFGYDPYITGAYTLRVIDRGLLKGFIPINIHWAGSTLDEYIELAQTVEQTGDILAKMKHIRCYPGFEVVRPEDIGHCRKAGMRITTASIALNRACLEQWDDSESDYVEFLLNPVEKLIAVRSIHENMPGAVRWRKIKDGRRVINQIGCTHFSELLYQLMSWSKLWNTSVLAQQYCRKGERVFIFDLCQYEINALPYSKPIVQKKRQNADVYYDIELMIAQQIELLHQKQTDTLLVDTVNAPEPGIETPAPKRKKLHPVQWRDSFGQRSEDAEMSCRRYQFHYMNEWGIDNSGVSVAGFDMRIIISPDEVQESINVIHRQSQMGDRRE